MSLLLITPTSGRPKAFDAVKTWIKNQSTTDFKWLVVTDDATDYKFDKSQIVINTEAGKLPSLNTNMLAAVEYIEQHPEYDRFIIIEDDDYYATNYIHETTKLFEAGDLVGWHEDGYYYVMSRKIRRCHNVGFAAFASTGFTRAVLPWLKSCCETGHVYIDKLLWQGIRETVLVNQPPVVTTDGRSITVPAVPMVRVAARWHGTTCLAHNFTGVKYGSREEPEMRNGLAVEHVKHVGMKENWHGGKVGISAHDPSVGGGLDIWGDELTKWIGNDAKFWLKFTKTVDRKGPYPPGVLIPLPMEDHVV